jgi:hypothetical protein
MGFDSDRRTSLELRATMKKRIEKSYYRSEMRLEVPVVESEV